MSKEKGKTNFLNDLSTSQKNEIRQGIKELDEGKRVSWESVLKENEINVVRK
jgi:hypothetical protein